MPPAPETLAPPCPARRRPVLRGVSYDTGANYLTGQGSSSREWWDLDRVRADLRAIRDDLGATTVTVEGSSAERLRATAWAAVELGLRVHLQPILCDQPQAAILAHIEDAAGLAEQLRGAGADVALSVGSEHLLFTPGIVDGATYRDRMTTWFETVVDASVVARRLDAFLAEALARARSLFSGKIYYAAGPFEEVDWSRFDYVGINLYYAFHPDLEGYMAELAPLHRWGKPVLICEFGSAPYVGGAQAGGDAWDVVDRSGPVPFVRDGVRRDEAAQAAHADLLLDVFELAGVHGVTVAPFVQPTHPHSATPRWDLDMACMAVVKAIRDDYDDHASPYRWEPKAVFHTIARRFRHYHEG